MTDMANGIEQSIGTATPVTPSPTAGATSDERTFRQNEVNDLVGRAKHEAVERYKREASIASHNYQAPPQPQYSGQPNQPYAAPAQPQHNGLSEQEYRRIAAEESQRLRNEWVSDAQRNAQEQDAQRITTEIFTKFDAAKGKYEDFDKTVDPRVLATMPNIVQLSNMVDNTADVIYDLMKNPGKIGQIQQLINMAQQSGTTPTLAFNEIKRLSDSIKENETASNFKRANEPLSQMRPSNAGTDNGVLGVKDYKRRYKV